MRIAATSISQTSVGGSVGRPSRVQHRLLQRPRTWNGGAISSRSSPCVMRAAAAGSVSQANGGDSAHHGMSRREAVWVLPAVTSAAGLLPAFASKAKQVVGLDTSWVTESFAQGTEFSLDAYKSMRDDGARTPKFVEAINRRLKGHEGELSVVDVGTGPFALLAIAAAKAGARQVYAIEADPKVAALARKAIAASGVPEGRIKVLEGLSTEVELPEKVDLLVAEVIGSVATEEGVYGTIRDAQARFLKAPEDPLSYIPLRVQTLVAPASYAFHYMIAAEGRKAAGLTSEEGPLRLNCTDETLAVMDEPQILEDFRYNDPSLPGPGEWKPPGGSLRFAVSSKCLAKNTQMYTRSLGFDGMPAKDAEAISNGVARGFSGIAMWPRLVLDPEGDLVVEARAPGGGPQRSHWQTVLPLMTKAPLPLSPGDSVEVSASALFKQSAPTEYRLHVDIGRA